MARQTCGDRLRKQKIEFRIDLSFRFNYSDGLRCACIASQFHISNKSLCTLYNFVIMQSLTSTVSNFRSNKYENRDPMQLTLNESNFLGRILSRANCHSMKFSHLPQLPEHEFETQAVNDIFSSGALNRNEKLFPVILCFRQTHVQTFKLFLVKFFRSPQSNFVRLFFMLCVKREMCFINSLA